MQPIQRAIERGMPGVRLKGRLENEKIGAKIRLNDLGLVIKRSRWRYEGHVLRLWN